MSTVCRKFWPAICFLCVLSAQAHHSNLMFDHDASVVLSGTVIEFQWRNPHVHILLEVEDEGGGSATWAIEGTTPAFMGRFGWVPDTLELGDAVSVTANPLVRPGRNLALGRSISLGNGSELIIPQAGDRDTVTDRTMSATSVDGRWLPAEDSLRQFFEPQLFWSLTEAGAQAVTAYEDTSNNPNMDCVLETLPFLNLVPLVLAIEPGSERTIIRSEGYAERVVHMDAASHEGAVDAHHGHSIGWWEDDVLVVDTSNFSANRVGNAVGGLPSGPRKHLMERFALNDDGTRLIYTFRLADPEFLAEPVTDSYEFVYRPDLDEVTYVECDLESARVFAEYDSG